MRKFHYIPNPVKDFAEVIFNATETNKALLTVLDHTGKDVSSAYFPVQSGLNNFRFDASSLPPGIYFITISDPADLLKFRFVKE